ncbi:hypothetical protein [Bartonella sp. DGB1]|uniref:hypothetical protein n=1 Tax=Bartonella sp. DGB1 TaxID=3239807 RepID=UPI003525738D
MFKDNLIQKTCDKFSNIGIAKKILSHYVTEYIEENLQRCQDLNFANMYPWQELQLPKNYFLQKIINYKGVTYLTGARYISKDITKPFIELLATSSVQMDISQDVKEILIEDWKEIKPLFIRNLISSDKVHADIDQEIWAANLQEMQSKTSITDLSIKLAKPEHLSFLLDALYKAYANIANADNMSLSPATADDIPDWVNKKQLYILCYLDTKVGFIACEEKRVGFMNGLYVAEEVILPEFQGRRFASLMQMMLAQKLSLHYSPDTLFYGTILFNNIASKRSAMHAGRKNILQYEKIY